MFKITPEGEIITKLHPVQGKAISMVNKANRLLYGGAAGGSKSHLARVSSIIEGLYIPDAQIYLIRSNFGALKKNHIIGPTGYNAMLAPLIDAGLCSQVKSVREGGWEIEFYRTNARIHLNQLAQERHLEKYIGSEILSLYLDESTQYEWEWIKMLHSRLRVGKELRFPEPFWWKDKNNNVIYRRGADGELETREDGSYVEMTSYPRSLLLTNPIGQSVHAHYEHFIKDKKPFTIYFNRKTQEYTQFIPAKVTDNPSIGAEYIASLNALPPDLRAALRDGKWLTSFGSFFQGIFNKYVHVVKNDEHSKKAIKYGFTEFHYDHGTSRPFSVQYQTEVKECNLTSVDGTVHQVPAGSIIISGELYGIKDDKWNTGLHLTVHEIAEMIKNFNVKFTNYYELTTSDTAGPPQPGRADKEIFTSTPDQRSVDLLFQQNNIHFTASAKGPGSIATGLRLICEYFRNVVLDDSVNPHLYILENAAPYFIKEMDASHRDLRNIDQLTHDSVDHAIDTCRYGLYQRTLTIESHDY